MPCLSIFAFSVLSIVIYLMTEFLLIVGCRRGFDISIVRCAVTQLLLIQTFTFPIWPTLMRHLYGFTFVLMLISPFFCHFPLAVDSLDTIQFHTPIQFLYVNCLGAYM